MKEERKKLSVGEIALIAIVAFAILLGGLWLHFRPKRFTADLSGPAGTPVSGYYEADGVRKNFTATLPSTLSFEYQHDYTFVAERKNPREEFSAAMKSDSSSYTASTDGDFNGIKATHSSLLPGFSSGSMGPVRLKPH